jgi:hypothetical protein
VKIMDVYSKTAQLVMAVIYCGCVWVVIGADSARCVYAERSAVCDKVERVY